jgi:putative NADH-flavin reductase
LVPPKAPVLSRSRPPWPRGHQVTAFARSPEKLTIEHASLTRRAGSFHDAAAVDAAVQGHDAVIITAAPSSLAGFKENPT